MTAWPDMNFRTCERKRSIFFTKSGVVVWYKYALYYPNEQDMIKQHCTNFAHSNNIAEVKAAAILPSIGKHSKHRTMERRPVLPPLLLKLCSSGIWMLLSPSITVSCSRRPGMLTLTVSVSSVLLTIKAYFAELWHMATNNTSRVYLRKGSRNFPFSKNAWELTQTAAKCDCAS